MNEELPGSHEALGRVNFKGLLIFSWPRYSLDMSDMWMTSTANSMRPVHITGMLKFPILNSKTCKHFPQGLINVILCPFLSLPLQYLYCLLGCTITIFEILFIEIQIGFFNSRRIIDIFKYSKHNLLSFPLESRTSGT